MNQFYWRRRMNIHIVNPHMLQLMLSLSFCLLCWFRLSCDYNLFTPDFLKKTLPSLSLDLLIVANRGVCQNSLLNGKQCRSWWDGFTHWVRDTVCKPNNNVVMFPSYEPRVKLWCQYTNQLNPWRFYWWSFHHENMPI